MLNYKGVRMSSPKKHQILTVVQTIGRSFFLPISILPVAGLLLGIGASFSNPDTIAQYGLQAWMGEGTLLNHVFLLMSTVGSAVFDNLPLLFALAVALGMAKEEKAVAVLSSGLAFIVMHKTISELLTFSGQILPNGELAENVVSCICSCRYAIIRLTFCWADDTGSLLLPGVPILSTAEWMSLNNCKNKINASGVVRSDILSDPLRQRISSFFCRLSGKKRMGVVLSYR